MALLDTLIASQNNKTRRGLRKSSYFDPLATEQALPAGSPVYAGGLAEAPTASSPQAPSDAAAPPAPAPAAFTYLPYAKTKDPTSITAGPGLASSLAAAQSPDMSRLAPSSAQRLTFPGSGTPSMKEIDPATGESAISFDTPQSFASLSTPTGGANYGSPGGDAFLGPSAATLRMLKEERDAAAREFGDIITPRAETFLPSSVNGKPNELSNLSEPNGVTPVDPNDPASIMLQLQRALGAGGGSRRP